MKNRRNFIKTLSAALCTTPIAGCLKKEIDPQTIKGEYDQISDFCKSLVPMNRILEMEGYYVWCNTPIYGSDNKVHVYFSRWKEEYGMGGWIHKCEIAHAVADKPEGPYEYVSTVLTPRPGYWDATTCHNPHIQYIDGKYCLFYMGNSNGKTHTKRIGLATADSPYGPWERPDKPLLEAGKPGSWDDHCTTNPAFIKHPNGQYWLYYKSWNTADYEQAKGKRIRGNRQYGLAIADNIYGPYIKYDKNPVIDFSYLGENQQLEDAYVWVEDQKIKLIARDMGFFDHFAGLYFESDDGLTWPKPEIAFYGTDHYFEQPPKPKHLNRYGRLERPQLLLKDGKPDYLFTTSQGGKYMTSSGYVFKIKTP